MPTISKEELESYIKKSLIDAYRNISVRKLGSDSVLGREVVIYEGTPRQPKEFSFKYTSWIDKEQYVPLKQVSYMWPNRFFMSFEYTDVQFDSDIPDGIINSGLEDPKNQLVKIDYLKKGIEDWDGAKAALGFSPLRPTNLPENMVTDGVRATPGPWPIFTIYFKSDIYHAMVVESVKGPPLPVEGWQAIKVDGNDISISNYFGLYLFQFKKKGIYNAVFGNLPFDKMIQIVRGL